MTAFPSLSAEVSFEYQVIARTGVTPIPDGVGTFSGFNQFPAIDSSGNVMFAALGGPDNAGQTQLGIYTALGVCCQKVMDRNTLLPGGQGDNFWLYGGEDQNDIDGGRVAFRASGQAGGEALYSNVGQASASELVKIAAIDGTDWSEGGEPWIDGDMVAMWGKRQPANENALLFWDGFTGFEDPGPGYAIKYKTQASISGDASIFQRYKINDSSTVEVVISTGGVYEILVEKNVTPMPGDESKTFSVLPYWPVVDRGGLDAAFFGIGPLQRGVYKRVNGGPLQRVADKSTTVPGSGGQTFSNMSADKLALANGSVAFVGSGTNLVDGIYTDVGGQLEVVVDDQANNIIELDGQAVEVTGVRMGPKSFAYTPQGYMVVFQAYLKTGGSAIVRATITMINDDQPGTSTASPPTADFENGNADGWLLNGNVAIDGILAIGDFSLRHGKSATSVLSVSTAGYDGVSVTMHLAATSLKKADGCFAEVSTNGGDSWVPVIEVHDGNDDGTFYSGTVSLPGADDNLNLQLRFRASGKGKKGYCYGDDVTVLGTLIGGVQSAP